MGGSRLNSNAKSLVRDKCMIETFIYMALPMVEIILGVVKTYSSTTSTSFFNPLIKYSSCIEVW